MAEAPSFGSFLRAAGKLAAARQVAGLLFLAGVLAVPAFAGRAWVTDFVWAYFAFLTLTSVLGLGFERLSATLPAGRDGTAASQFVAALVMLRLLAAPLTAVGLWALLLFVGVALPPVAWWATLVWITAALVAQVAFGVRRARGDARTEPLVVVCTRVGQTVVLVAAASAGASLGLTLTGIAGVEVLGAVVATRTLGSRWWHPSVMARLAQLPWRRAIALAGIEVVALAYLRADLLLVGRILGPALGATYGLLYRVIDGLNGTVGSAGLWLFATTANDRDGGENPTGLRARSLELLPWCAIGVGLFLVVPSELVGSVVPRLAGQSHTLLLLLAAFPLLTVNSVELHVRSGRGRNREVLQIGASALIVNVLACLVLVPAYGLHGAALALVVSEVLQSTLLLMGDTSADRSVLGRAVTTAIGGALLLLWLGTLLHGTVLSVAFTALATVGFVVCASLRGRSGRPTVVP